MDDVGMVKCFSTNQSNYVNVCNLPIRAVFFKGSTEETWEPETNRGS